MKFKTGDIVILKKNGQKMTMREYKKNMVVCDWFDAKAELYQDAFKESHLKKELNFKKGDMVVINKSKYTATVVRCGKIGLVTIEWISPEDGATCQCTTQEELITFKEA